ncbi:styrene monooxygenase/indole monooxygenase family protein [Actinorugispora endophytica]|uniref:2-polyprenyl-6-methoxyphenol hydroxylase-like FAD-dependent oxidoreductase n=1 Tax=Actinorugispora endophytica TaxID=1605990 RepID=A0A4R6V3B9_9ACTN|nr:styrene monooxygenase/indole monooxygenase family protein [Actinorugispora endophytica]TDQ53027.1 2-polyprenyl-6-methoxyphenol hydroxylase-like FAD-dependent oxidoreductase [Actinorugispora endophytica]
MSPLSPRVLIIGAGQSGLYLGHQLLKNGYEVGLITSKTSPEIRNGPASVTQFAFPSTRALEEQAGLDQWRGIAPRFDRVRMSLRAPEQPPTEFSGSFGNSPIARRIGGHAVSVDRRVKMSHWLEYFEDQGGKVYIHGVTPADLEYFVRMYDLVVVAVGAGELGSMFSVDPGRSSGGHERVVTQAILDGVAWDGDQQVDVYSTIGGEVFFTPVLTEHGEATSVTMLANPGAALDASGMAGRDPGPLLAGMQTLLREYLPDVYERIRHLGVGDLVGGRNSLTQTRFTPAVRRPVAELHGKPVLGMADVVITSDPVAGQGWANSTFCAQAYADAIVAHQGEWDAAFMEAAFETFYQERGRHAAVFSDMVHGFWSGQMPEHFGELMGAVLQHQEVADRWIGGFDDPADYERWMFDPRSARDYIASVVEAKAN